MLTPVSTSEAHSFLTFNLFHLCVFFRVLSLFLGEQQPGGSVCLCRSEVEGTLSGWVKTGYVTTTR